MYGLPKDIDLTFLEGKELEQVWVGLCNVQLHFARENIGIAIEGRYIHHAKKKASEWNIGAGGQSPIAACSLLTLIGSSIVKVKATPKGTLTLNFSNKDTLTIFDDDPMYEAYQIWHGNEPLIVV